MCYQSEILAFKPTYEVLAPLFAGRQKFARPLSVKEVGNAVYFAGNLYDARGLTEDELQVIVIGHRLFRDMQGRCPQIMGCDMSNVEYPFTVWKNRDTGAANVSFETTF